YCDTGMVVVNNKACPYECPQSLVAPAFTGSIVTMDTHSHGGGYSPYYHEYWYPQWAGSTVYRYNDQHQFLGTFDSGQNQMMQLWGDVDGSYYTANWDYQT